MGMPAVSRNPEILDRRTYSHTQEPLTPEEAKLKTTESDEPGKNFDSNTISKPQDNGEEDLKLELLLPVKNVPQQKQGNHDS